MSFFTPLAAQAFTRRRVARHQGLAPRLVVPGVLRPRLRDLRPSTASTQRAGHQGHRGDHDRGRYREARDDRNPQAIAITSIRKKRACHPSDGDEAPGVHESDPEHRDAKEYDNRNQPLHLTDSEPDVESKRDGEEERECDQGRPAQHWHHRDPHPLTKA